MQDNIPFQFKKPTNKFAVLEGRYRATLWSATTLPASRDQSKKMVKFTFDITADENGPVKLMAKKEYELVENGSEDLLRDMDAFYGAFELSEMMKAEQQINLADLVGKNVDLYISTFPGKGYKVPYSKIDSIFPPGRLLPAEQEADDDDSSLAA